MDVTSSETDDSQASTTWLLERHGISSRKITNIVTKRELNNFDDIKKSKGEFYKHLIRKIFIKTDFEY